MSLTSLSNFQVPPPSISTNQSSLVSPFPLVPRQVTSCCPVTGEGQSPWLCKFLPVDSCSSRIRSPLQTSLPSGYASPNLSSPFTFQNVSMVFPNEPLTICCP